MQTLKSKKKWVEDFNEAEALVGDLEVLMEFQQAGEVTEAEVEQQYKKAVQNMTIKFTYKQVKWQKYYVLYKKLQVEKNTENRTILRKLVESARKQVYNASISNVKNLCKLIIQ